MFYSQDRLDDKLDKIISMMSKSTAQGSSQNRLLNLKFNKEKGEDKLEIIAIRIDTRIGIDQTVVIRECHVEVEPSVEKIIEEGHSMIKIREVTLGKEILEEYQIIEVKILGVDIEVTLGMTVLEEVAVGLEKDSIQVMLGGMIEVTVDQDQIQEQVPIEIELDALSVGSMITLPNTVQIYQKQKRAVRSDTADALLRGGQDSIKGSCGRHL